MKPYTVTRLEKRKAFQEWIWAYFTLGLGCSSPVTQAIFSVPRELEGRFIFEECSKIWYDLLDNFVGWKASSKIGPFPSFMEGPHWITFSHLANCICWSTKPHFRFVFKCTSYTNAVVLEDLSSTTDIHIDFWGAYLAFDRIKAFSTEILMLNIKASDNQ
jgi:hypothetical protein